MNKPIKQIAKDFTSGGKVSISEARCLAAEYLHILGVVERLVCQVNELQGGETVTLKADLYAKGMFDPKDRYINSFTRANGTIGAFETELLLELRALLSKNVDQQCIGSLCTLTGPYAHLEKFLRINHIISELLQAAYDEGHRNGRNLLFGLAEGSLSVSQFNKMSEDGVK